MKTVEKMLDDIINNYCLDYIAEKIINYRFNSNKMIVKLGLHKNELSIVLEKIDEIIYLSEYHKIILSNKRLEGFFK